MVWQLDDEEGDDPADRCVLCNARSLEACDCCGARLCQLCFSGGGGFCLQARCMTEERVSAMEQAMHEGETP